MSDDWELHLSFKLLEDFACGTVRLDALQLEHLQNCEECRESFSVFKSEAEVSHRTRRNRQAADRIRVNLKRR